MDRVEPARRPVLAGLRDLPGATRHEVPPHQQALAERQPANHEEPGQPAAAGLPIFSRDVLRRIAANDDSWEDMVPGQVAELIRRRGFFGYVKPGVRD